MINYNELSTNERKFIKSIPEGFKFGVPVKLFNDTYYPINHRELFLRYYVSYSGYIYDITLQKTTKYSYDDIIEFYAVEKNNIIIMHLQEVIWRTFYRFPEGKDMMLNKPLEYKPSFIKDRYDGDGYYINGIKFRHPRFPVNSRIFDEVITKSKMKIAISENGAIYNIKSRYFVMVHQDDTGYPFIYSKSCEKIRINELIAYSWYSDIYDANKYLLMTTMCSEIFISKNTLLMYHQKKNDIYKIANELQKLNYSEALIDKIMYKNAFEFFKRNL